MRQADNVSGGKLRVTQDKDKPIEKEVLAAHIIEISRGITRILSTGLNRKAIIALLRDSTGLGKSTLKIVLDGIEQLEHDYCR